LTFGEKSIVYLRAAALKCKTTVVINGDIEKGFGWNRLGTSQD